MQRRTVVVTHAVGLHARPAVRFVNLAKGFASDITITNTSRDSEKCVSAKSLVALIKIACAQGHSLLITADGSDEDEAIEALVDFVQSGE